MKTGRLLPACLPLLLFCVLIAPGKSNASSDLTAGDARLRVVVCDRVGLTSHQLKVAGRELTRILLAAGIAVSVDAAEASSSAVQSETGCDSPGHPAGRYVLAVLAREAFSPVSGAAMGFAMGGAFPRVYVFMDRVRDFADRHWSRSKGDLPILIGHVMAHELGHLLLPAQSHTAFGIMSTAWGPKQAADAASGTLLFFKDEAKAIRQGLLGQSPLSGN